MPTIQSSPRIAIQPSTVTQPLAVPYHDQGGYKNLCWAACAQMMLEFSHQGHASLCETADFILKRGCCADLSICDTTQDPTNVYKGLGYSSTYIDDPLDEDSLQKWLLAGYPVQTNIEWTLDLSHHTTLLVGWQKETNRYLVHDPLGVKGWNTYSEVLAPSSAGYWVGTWYNIVKKPNA